MIAGPDKQVPVVGVAAAGQAPGGSMPAAQYNLLEIDGGPGDWYLKLTRRGLTGPSMPASEISSTVLGGHAPSLAAAAGE